VTQPGRRLYLAGSIALILVAGLHTWGQLAPPPADQALATVTGMMRGVRLDMGLGMHPSVYEIFRSLAFTMSVTLVVMGVFGVIIARAEDSSGRLLRRAILTSTIAVGVLVVLYAVYRIPPPLITLAVVELLFLTALVRAITPRVFGP
jgi:hypothetical protein